MDHKDGHREDVEVGPQWILKDLELQCLGEKTQGWNLPPQNNID